AFAVATQSKGRKPRAGEYLFRRGANVSQVVATLLEGKAVLHSIAIPEGLTSDQIVSRLTENELLSGEIREVPAEGTLLPDTYRVERGMSRMALLKQMQEKQRAVVDRIWAQRDPDLPIKSPRELIVLASIVEKET